MMYLDDFVESIETLPQDMKHYYSHMRSLDLRLNNTHDVTKKRFKRLCENATNLPQSALTKEMSEIKSLFKVGYELAEEKVQLSSQTYDVLDRQIRRLEGEIDKFKTDLEGTRPGITDTLKQQSEALDTNSGNHAEQIQQAASESIYKRKFGVATEAAKPMAMPEPIQKKVSSIKVAKGFIGNRGIPAIVLPPEHNVDPNEPRYCICNQVSYGDMVGCDNDDCKLEWFHYPCVGLTEEPKGKWFCPDCRAQQTNKRRKIAT
eukprot:m.115661 g.115661  ORF g.115661 m.115661 type:complete len:261 (-) comp28438_c1_seq1:341-1123(-)